MFLLVPSHSGSPGKIGHKMVVVVVVVVRYKIRDRSELFSM